MGPDPHSQWRHPPISLLRQNHVLPISLMVSVLTPSILIVVSSWTLLVFPSILHSGSFDLRLIIVYGLFIHLQCSPSI